MAHRILLFLTLPLCLAAPPGVVPFTSVSPWMPTVGIAIVDHTGIDMMAATMTSTRR